MEASAARIRPTATRRTALKGPLYLRKPTSNPQQPALADGKEGVSGSSPELGFQRLTIVKLRARAADLPAASIAVNTAR